MFPHRFPRGPGQGGIERGLEVDNDGDSVSVRGLPQDVTGVQPSMTFMQGKDTTILGMEFCVVDLCWPQTLRISRDYSVSILVLLTNNLVASPSTCPVLREPLCKDFQESTVTCCEYMVDCPGSHTAEEVVVMGLYKYSVGTRQVRGGHVEVVDQIVSEEVEVKIYQIA